MRKKIRIIVVAGVIAAVGGIAIAARDAKDEGKAAAPPAGAPMAPQVPVAEVITRTVAPSAEYTGFLAAPKTVELRSRVGGAVDAVSVPEGSLVRKGQLPFQVALDTAVAQLRQAEVLASQAQADFDRAERLVATGAVARKTYDDAASARNARQAQVQAAKAAVAAAQLDLSYARVTAPIAGRVDRVLVTEGNLVSGGGAGAATLLTTIVSIDPLHVYFDIDEATYLNVVSRSRPAAGAGSKASLPVQVGLTTDKGFPHRGALDFVGNTIDRSTGTIRARAVVPNPDGRMAPGMFARAKLSTGAAREAVLIDDQAVGTDQGRNYVLVVGENNQAQYRPIELGPVVDGLRVINGGLQAGEKIIIKGLVRPGMAVTPRMVPMQPPAAPAAGATGATKAAANAPAPAAAPAKAGGADPAKADGAAGSAEARK